MKTVFRLLLVIVASMPVLAQAQSGIGLPPFDADVAFHIRTGSFDHGLRVDGLVDDPTDLLTDVIVRDANGVLFYRPITDLTVSGEWIDHPSLPYIFANQADAAGNRVVVTDAGNLGIGTVAPRNSIEVNTGIIIGTGVQGAYSTAEDIRLAGGATSDAIITTQDGSGRLNLKWNASNGGSPVFLANGDYASQIMLGGFAANDPDGILTADGDIFRIQTSTTAGVQGNSISWRYPFTIEHTGEVGINTNNPRGQLDINGSIYIDRTDIPIGTINGAPTDPEVLLLVPSGTNQDQVQRISANDLFNNEGEWVDDNSGNFIYARRARDEGATDDVVINDDGELGIGLTNPQAKIHLRNGGIRVDGLDYGISFNGENPDGSVNPIFNGSRIYHDNGIAGIGNALVIEKTDRVGEVVNGGIVFTNREENSSRYTSMVIRGDGEVGVGRNLTNPLTQFQVNGDVLVRDGGANPGDGTSGRIQLVDYQATPFRPWATKGYQVTENGDYVFLGLQTRAANHEDAVLVWGNNQNEDLRFINTQGNSSEAEVMHLDGEYHNVGIGVTPVGSHDIKLHVGGQVRVDDLDPQGSFNTSSDLIVIADANGDLKTVTSSLFQQDFEDLDWTVLGNGEMHNANSGPIGIGLVDPENSSALHINGNLRMENSSAIELDDVDVRIFAPNDGELDIEAHTLTTFQHRGTGVDPLVVDHQNGRISVGIGRAGNALSATVDGVLRMQDDSELQFGTDPDNMLYAQSATDFRLTAQSLFSVRARNDAIGVLTVQTGNGGANRQVGILTNSPQDALDVNGRLRVRDVPVENGFDQFLVVDPANGQVRRRELANFEGPWDRSAAGDGRTFLRTVTDHVGIGTSAPVFPLHIVEPVGSPHASNNGTLVLDHEDNGGQSSIVFRSRVNRGSDYGYINYFDDNPDLTAGSSEQSLLEIGTQNDDNNTNRDDVAIMPSSNLGVKTRTPSRTLDVNGNLRVRTLADTPTDIYALTADANGNNNGMSLRYHSSADGSTDGFEILRGAATNTNAAHVHFRVERNNGQVTINNLATGAADEMVIADANGVLSTQAFPDAIWDKDDTDSEIFLDAAVNAYRVGIGTNAPVRKLHVNGDVRIESIGSGGASDDVLTVDANGDVRSLPMSDFENYWTRDGGTGALYPATSADNVGIGESNPSAKLHVDGDAIVSSMTTGVVGTDEIVVVDANGLLKKIPGNSYDAFWDRITSGSQDYVQLSTNTDFVGIGTTGAPAVQFHTTGGVRFESLANAGNEVVVADASGNLSTQALPPTLWVRNLLTSTTSPAFGADNIGIGTTDAQERLHLASGLVRIDDLPSEGGDLTTDRVVTVDANGVLGSVSGADALSPWREDASNRVVLKNNDSWVGIGTQSPLGVLHVLDDMPNTGDPMEVRLQNRRGNGEINLRFRTGLNSGGTSDENNSMVLRYTNQYDAMEITNGYASADVAYSSHFKVMRNNGRVGINVGTAVPSQQLHIIGNQLLDGNLIFEDNHIVQFAETNSFLRDGGNNLNTGADSDVILSASDDLSLRASGATGEIYFTSGGTANRAILHENGRFEVLNTPSTWDFDVAGQSLLTGNVQMESNVRVNNLGGGGIQMVVADNAGNLGVQPIVVDTDDQNLTWTPGTSTLSIEDGNSVDLSALLDNTDAQAISVTSDVLSITGNASTVDLSPYLDNTDAQAISLISNTLSISGNASTVDLSGYVNTDAQDLSLAGNILSLTNDGTTVDLSGYVNTDAQAMSYDGATGIITLVNGGTVNLATSSIIDDQDLELTGSILSLTNDASPVDLSAFANTDAQAISLVGDELRITGNASVVDLAAYANTDAQALSYDAATGVLTLANGGPAINLSASTIIDDQTLSLSGTELTIANGNMVDLAPIGVLSSGWSRSGTDVTLGGGATSVGIGTSPASGVALHVTGVARFDGLAGTGLGFVMADASGNLTRRVISSVTGWNYTGGTNMSLANASQNLMVGIGTATAKLHVDGSTLLDGSLEVSEAATFNNDVNIDLSTTGTKMTITGNGTDDPLQLINVQAAGAAPHNVLVLDALCNVQVVNGVTASDRRLKENIKPMEGTLEKLLGMESVTFNYRKDVKDYPYSLDEETHYGVIAQQVQAAFPHAVVEKDGYLYIQEKELIGVVISATKELSAKNAELEATNEHLAEQLHHMMMDKADLEKTVHSLEAQTSELQTSMDQVLQHIANGKQVQAGGN